MKAVLAVALALLLPACAGMPPSDEDSRYPPRDGQCAPGHELGRDNWCYTVPSPDWDDYCDTQWYFDDRCDGEAG